MKKLTPEEQKQVQNLINARTKIFTEQISRQEAQISMLTSQLDAKDKELSGLRTQLTESQKLTESLQAEPGSSARNHTGTRADPGTSQTRKAIIPNSTIASAFRSGFFQARTRRSD